MPRPFSSTPTGLRQRAPAELTQMEQLIPPKSQISTLFRRLKLCLFSRLGLAFGLLPPSRDRQLLPPYQIQPRLLRLSHNVVGSTASVGDTLGGDGRSGEGAQTQESIKRLIQQRKKAYSRRRCGRLPSESFRQATLPRADFSHHFFARSRRLPSRTFRQTDVRNPHLHLYPSTAVDANRYQ